MAFNNHIDHWISRFRYTQIFLVILVTLLAPGIHGSQTAENQHAAYDLGIRWIEIEAGSFTFGNNSNTTQATVGRFKMSATEITFDQYDAFCSVVGKQKPDDNGWGRGTRPVLNVSYDDALEFCQWLSTETGSTVRLPNEIEWEYAAQGGCHSKGYTHSGGNNKNEVSWNEDNSGNRTHPVGTKNPNELGLYDMSGNLWEWCADRPKTNSSRSQTVSQVIRSDDKRLVRGNSFDNPGDSMDYKQSLRIHKDSRHINIGFRIVKSD